MPLIFPSASIGQTYQSGSSATYTWNGNYWTISAEASTIFATAATASYVDTDYGQAVLGTNITVSNSTPTTIIDFTIPSAGVWKTTYFLNFGSDGSNVNDESTTYFTDSSNVIIPNSLIRRYIYFESNMFWTDSQICFLVTTGATAFKARISRTAGTAVFQANRSKVTWRKVG
jgi:hypothetical protein